MSFIKELKRRNVVRVGIAYVVGGWLLLQFTEVLSELLNLPEHIGPIVVAIVAIGLPIALFLAWAYELTPEGVKREKDVDRSASITPQTGKSLNNTILVLMAVAIAYLLFDKFSTGSEPVSPETLSQTAQTTGADSVQTPEVETPAISRQSIAVLPFDNRSDQKSDEFFVEGIHDDLLTNLARIGSLKVISRTSVGKYKDTEKTIPEIALELGVATVMEGAVQRAGDTVRINVQLIDAQTDEHLWAEIFDRELTTSNLFAIQTEISEAIASALEATLTTEEQAQISRRPTENMPAYHAYMRGRQLQEQRTSAALDQALVEFRRAVELDDQFAQAWVGVADTLILLTSYGTLELSDVIPQVSSAIERALEIDPLLGEAHTSQGNLLSLSAPWPEVEAAYKRGIELSPNYARAYHWYANDLKNQPAQLNKALALSQKAVELDPMSPVLRSNLASTYRALGEFAKAEAGWLEVLELNPDFAAAYSSLSLLNGQVYGRFDEGLKWVLKSQQLDPGNIGIMLDEFMPLVLAGEPALAAQVLQRMQALDEQSLTIPLAQLLQNLLDERFAAASELATYLVGKNNLPYMQWAAGWALANNARYERARELMLLAEPGYTDKTQWQRLLAERQSDACLIGWVLMKTGDESLGMELIENTLTYLEETLPRYRKHADVYFTAGCHAARGDIDSALTAVEVTVEHNHFNSWKFGHIWPPMRELRDEPRYIAASEKVEAELARQREAINLMYADEDTSP